MNKILDCQQFLDGKILCFQETTELPRIIHPNDVDISTVIVGPVTIIIGLVALKLARDAIMQGLESIKENTKREQSKDYAEGVGHITRLILEWLDSIELVCKNCRCKSPAEFRELLNDNTGSLGVFLSEYEGFLEKVTEKSHSVMISESYLRIENKINQINECIIESTDKSDYKGIFKETVSEKILSRTINSRKRHVGITRYISCHISMTHNMTASIELSQ